MRAASPPLAAFLEAIGFGRLHAARISREVKAQPELVPGVTEHGFRRRPLTIATTNQLLVWL